MRRRFASLALAAALIAVGPALADPARAGESPYFTDTGVFADKSVAIRGYDPVAYFKAGEPVEGSDEHSLQWGGVTWHFASAENKRAFEADPTAYAPKYGGYCAYAVAKGQLVSIDPEAWSIVDGELYLNYSKRVRATWEQDIEAYIAQAEETWPELDPAD